ncbi:hypothetical protein QOZ80_2AG0138070 [Eleusine coracana subsp. coracana]|nr:hypothetical protein QOZ80_2AG0138070 [Eleusine coracana subsp. coracana]
MITFADLTAPAGAGGERCVDRQLWLACAGSMCTVPPVGASVYYFPQGHAEHAGAGAADLSALHGVQALIPCRVVAVRYMADPDTDEVFARIRLVPLRGGPDEDDGAEREEQEEEKPASFAKTLTQSDANNGGGFSVPRYCAETIFPRLDYAADPPVQTVVARDVHGAAWKFRHIYRGTPRRHLLTTGWSTFVNSKKLVAGDSIVFLRGAAGDLHVGIRRAKRGAGFCGGEEGPVMAGWDPYAGVVMRGSSNVGGPCGSKKARAKVRPEDVAEAARMAGAGREFEVTYYPRASTPEFCVRAAAVRAAARVQWGPGMRFKMAFETEDSSRISWFMGTIAGVQVADPVRWPQSPWRLLQVTWDEPDLLQNVKRVSPWLVELVSAIPSIHLAPSSSFSSPPRQYKKPRPAPYPEFPFEGGHILNPPFPPNPVPYRHHFPNPYPSLFPSFPDGVLLQPYREPGKRDSFHPYQIPTSQTCSRAIPPAARIDTDLTIGGADQVSCALSIGANSNNNKPHAAVKPAAGLMLFGQTILTEQQMSLNTTTSSSGGSAASPAATRTITSSRNWIAGEMGGTYNVSSEGSGSGVIQNESPTNKASSERPHWFRDLSEPGQCKVFVESDAVGRDLDLSALRSFDELYARLSEMFCVDSAELRSHVLYRGANGEVKHAGDESFSDFVRSARRLTILTDAGSDNLGSS